MNSRHSTRGAGSPSVPAFPARASGRAGCALLALVAAGLLAVPGPAAGPAPKPRGARTPLPHRDRLSEAAGRVRRLEFVEMLTAVLSGSDLGPGVGWFHPGQSRYGWKWLADRYDVNR